MILLGPSLNDRNKQIIKKYMTYFNEEFIESGLDIYIPTPGTGCIISIGIILIIFASAMPTLQDLLNPIQTQSLELKQDQKPEEQNPTVVDIRYQAELDYRNNQRSYIYLYNHHNPLSIELVRAFIPNLLTTHRGRDAHPMEVVTTILPSGLQAVCLKYSVSCFTTNGREISTRSITACCNPGVLALPRVEFRTGPNRITITDVRSQHRGLYTTKIVDHLGGINFSGGVNNQG